VASTRCGKRHAYLILGRGASAGLASVGPRPSSSLLSSSTLVLKPAGPARPHVAGPQHHFTALRRYAAAFSSVAENQGRNTTTADGNGALFSAPPNRSRPRTNRTSVASMT